MFLGSATMGRESGGAGTAGEGVVAVVDRGPADHAPLEAHRPRDGQGDLQPAACGEAAVCDQPVDPTVTPRPVTVYYVPHRVDHPRPGGRGHRQSTGPRQGPPRTDRHRPDRLPPHHHPRQRPRTKERPALRPRSVRRFPIAPVAQHRTPLPPGFKESPVRCANLHKLIGTLALAVSVTAATAGTTARQRFIQPPANPRRAPDGGRAHHRRRERASGPDSPPNRTVRPALGRGQRPSPFSPIRPLGGSGGDTGRRHPAGRHRPCEPAGRALWSRSSLS